MAPADHREGGDHYLRKKNDDATARSGSSTPELVKFVSELATLRKSGSPLSFALISPTFPRY
jgi:hypothetical protein